MVGVVSATSRATQSAALAQPQVALPNFADLVEKYGPAVVDINTQARAGRNPFQGQLDEDDPFYDFFRRFLPPDQRQAPRGRNGDPPKGAPKAPLRPQGLDAVVDTTLPAASGVEVRAAATEDGHAAGDAGCDEAGVVRI